jgi:glutaredoxin
VSPRRRSRGVCIRRPSVTVYYADNCSLCERAKSALAEVRRDVEFELREVNITGDAELEARYREWLPVVEIDGERAFVYHVDAGVLLRKLRTKSESEGV